MQFMARANAISENLIGKIRATLRETRWCEEEQYEYNRIK